MPPINKHSLPECSMQVKCGIIPNRTRYSIKYINIHFVLIKALASAYTHEPQWTRNARTGDCRARREEEGDEMKIGTRWAAKRPMRFFRAKGLLPLLKNGEKKSKTYPIRLILLTFTNYYYFIVWVTR